MKNESFKRVRAFAIIAIFVSILITIYGFYSILWHQKLENSYILFAGTIFTWLSIFYLISISKQFEEHARNQNIQSQKQKLEKEFLDNKEIFIKIPNGEHISSYVISKYNGWRYENKRFINKDNFFDIDDIYNNWSI